MGEILIVKKLAETSPSLGCLDALVILRFLVRLLYLIIFYKG